MDNNIPVAESGNNNSSNEELARQIEKSEYNERKNGRETYTAENGMKISIGQKDQAGADQMVDWLRGNTQTPSDTPIQSAFEKAMSGQRPPITHDTNESDNSVAPKQGSYESQGSSQNPVDLNKYPEVLIEKEPTVVSSESTPIQSALEKAMNGQRPPITHETKDSSVAPKQGSYESQGSSQNPIDLNKYPEILISAEKDTPTISAENAAHQEEMRRFRNQTTVGITGENIGGSGEPNRNDGMAEAAMKEKLHKEELDRNRSLNEGFAPTRSNPEAAKALGKQDTIIAELNKETTPTEDLHKETEEKELTPEQQELKEMKVLIKEQSAQIQQLILIMQLNITHIQNNNVINGGATPSIETTTPTESGTVTPEVTLTPEQQEIADIRATVSKTSEQINQLMILMQQNNINVQNNNGVPASTEVTPPAETTATTTTTQESAPVAPETTPTPEARRKLKIAYIAGAVIGGSTGILGGVPAAGIGALTCIAGGLLNTGINKLSGSGIERWNRRLATVTDPAERTKLEKRVARLEKIKTFTETTAKDFLRGARHGLLASAIFSGVFLGAHGLAWNTPEPIMPTSTNPTGPSHIEPRTPTAPETGGAGGGAEGPIEPTTFEGNSFIKDGRVNLPGDAIDGQMAGAPDQSLTGNPSLDSYGGQSQVGGYQLDLDLEANRIPDDVWNQMPQIDQHRIYNQYWEAAKAGNNNPDLAQELQKLGSEGAKKVLQFMGK